jgi:hypothetical protein
MPQPVAPTQPSRTPSGPRINGIDEALLSSMPKMTKRSVHSSPLTSLMAWQRTFEPDVAVSVHLVLFGFDTNANFRTKNVAPYAFAGDKYLTPSHPANTQ